MNSFKLKSFAKINPLLVIGENREDGYHNIYTVYQTVSIYDQIELKIKEGREGIKINSNRDIPLNNDNLVYKAINLFLHEFNITGYSFDIFIDKRIPSGGGMGGGSSNAGTVLRFLKGYFKVKADKKIERLAARVGSDVPLFLYGGTVLGLRKGDEITKVRDLANTDFLAVFTGKHYPTEKMYKLFDEKCEKLNYSLPEFSQKTVQLYKEGYKEFYNDFDRILEFYDREIYDLFLFLKKKGYKTMLSGSGSTFLIFGENLSKAKKILPENFEVKRLEFINGLVYEKLLQD